VQAIAVVQVAAVRVLVQAVLERRGKVLQGQQVVRLVAVVAVVRVLLQHHQRVQTVLLLVLVDHLFITAAVVVDIHQQPVVWAVAVAAVMQEMRQETVR
jgi:hypothetical protein